MGDANKEAAIQEKTLGNEAYKAKNFAEAHVHYDAALALDPENVALYTNKAAAFFEEAKYDECIAQCARAVEVGRETRADFKLIAKALQRAGNAHLKKGELKEAISFLQKSVSEHRDPEVVKKVRELENELKERERRAYVNPELAEQEKLSGNELFKKGDYPGAIKHYNEAVKRNPDSAVLFSNRAACYTKLMEFQRAIDDCTTAIKLDPKFIKAYIRKGAAYLAIKSYSEAQKAYEGALALDENNAEAKDGLRTAILGSAGAGSNSDDGPDEQAIMRDPELQAILRDPGMRLILEQMSQDPSAIREHLKDPVIAQKLMKLQSSGVIRFASR